MNTKTDPRSEWLARCAEINKQLNSISVAPHPQQDQLLKEFDALEHQLIERPATTLQGFPRKAGIVSTYSKRDTKYFYWACCMERGKTPDP